ncbi:MAG TPA: PHP domain-containing protein [Chloroflexi bacterium]|nr:PHP domain-containing protein [Chloroflexota bacterium]
MSKKKRNSSMQWYSMDLHLHTPASSDYQEKDVSYLDILRKAEAEGMDIIAFTDHNTVAGYRQMQEEIQQLELLEKLDRLLPEEKSRLEEYRRLLKKILVLPGFEFTATFGFHILGIFPPEKPPREIEHILLDLNIPPDQLDEGSATVGASSDVLTAYRAINQAGGLVIAAHANSSNGVAMRGFPFGGQTKIAYTQDPNLHALEVTDLERKGPRTTAAFFNGAKPEYPRRMHCIQGSDAHRLKGDPQRKKNLGVGERATDVRLKERSFEALKSLFLSNDFARTRPHRASKAGGGSNGFDFIQAAREEGPNIVQDFHEGMTVRGGKLYAIIADVCAFANTNGGTLYVGVSADPKKKPVGIAKPEQAIAQLEKEINNRISPPINCTLDVQESGGKKIVRILVPRGDDPPYAVDENKIYVRAESETGLAVRDEIVSLVLRGHAGKIAPAAAGETSAPPTPEEPSLLDDSAPRTGVEVVSAAQRKGTRYYVLRDLRNGNTVNNVTERSARRLWHYAIKEYDKVIKNLEVAVVQWQGDYGLLRRYRQAKNERYDFIQRTPQGYRYFFGVTDDGLHGPWAALLGKHQEQDEE